MKAALTLKEGFLAIKFMFGSKPKLSDLAMQVVTHSGDAVIIIDKSQNILFYNDGAARIFGYANADVLGHNLNILLPDRFHLQHGLMVGEFGAAPAVTKHMGQRARQIYGQRKDGSEFVASVQIIKLGTGSHMHYAAIVRDISQDKKTEEELLRLAATDPLTGAFNRREFTALAEREAMRANRYNHALSILMLDLDYFKKLNDTYGHAAGDKALQRFTTICCNALRNVDIFGRWGGEEFIALLPETDIEGAAVISERLRKMVEDSDLSFNGNIIKFTVSIGVAQYKDNEVALDSPLDRADAAVYDAKRAGRNRISVYRSN